MTNFVAADSEYANRVRDSFSRQLLMKTLGAVLTRVEPGIIEIELPHRPEVTQQHGLIHAGALASILDSACGYAAYTLMPADAAVLSVEFKVNLLAPARGDKVVATAEVKRSGRTITVCSADAFAEENGERKLVATMLGTMMCMRGRTDMSG